MDYREKRGIGNMGQETGSTAVRTLWSLVWEIKERFALEGERMMAVVAVAVLLCAVAGYLLGSLNAAILLSRLRLRRDVRECGSGNAGATNMLRTYGTKYAVLTLALDMLKAAVSVALGYLIFGTTGASVAGFFCVFGHMFPLYYHFRGGKGVACTAIVILMLSPWAFLVILGCFIVVVAFTRYVSLASILCALLYPLLLRAFPPFGDRGIPLVMAVLTTVFVVFMHRENIRRLYEGKESKLDFHRKNKGDGGKDGDDHA